MNDRVKVEETTKSSDKEEWKRPEINELINVNETEQNHGNGGDGGSGINDSAS